MIEVGPGLWCHLHDLGGNLVVLDWCVSKLQVAQFLCGVFVVVVVIVVTSFRRR